MCPSYRDVLLPRTSGSGWGSWIILTCSSRQIYMLFSLGLLPFPRLQTFSVVPFSCSYVMGENSLEILFQVICIGPMYNVVYVGNIRINTKMFILIYSVIKLYKSIVYKSAGIWSPFLFQIYIFPRYNLIYSIVTSWLE